MLAAAIGASSDPAREPETSSEETDDAVAAVVYGPLVDGSLHNIDRLLRSRGGSRGLVDNLRRRRRVGRLLVDRSRRLVADLSLVTLLIRIVVSHIFTSIYPRSIRRSGRLWVTRGTVGRTLGFSKNEKG